MEDDGRILNVGPLRAPHYELTLEPGAAMMSTREGDCWVVRFVYDPVNYDHMQAVREFREHPDGRIDVVPAEQKPFHQDPDVKPPLVVAFGDPGESREEVEKAFLEAICSAWCQMLERMLGRRHGEGEESWMAGKGHFDELCYPDVWQGEVNAIDYDLLCMVATADGLGGLGAHSATDVSLEEQRAFWNSERAAFGRFSVLTMPTEAEYFDSRIPEWRRACKSSASRVHGRLDPPSGIF